VTCLPALLTAFVVIAASLLGGCADDAINAAGSAAGVTAPTAKADPGAQPPPAKQAAAPAASSQDVEARLASATVSDAGLSDIRGGYDAGAGVTLNFAFQQATFVNHNLTENIVVPTLTISPAQGTISAPGMSSVTAAAHSILGIGSLSGLGIAGSPQTSAATGISSATVVANGTVQTQVNVPTPALQSLVNSGMASVIGGTIGAAGSNGGVTTTLTNASNNQLIQQVTTVDIGLSGLSKLMQQGASSTVMNRLVGPGAFR
jgi:hypothetical protein